MTRFVVVYAPPPGIDGIPGLINIEAENLRQAKARAAANIPRLCRILSIKRYTKYDQERYLKTKQEAFDARQRVIARLAALKDQP